MYYLFKKDPWGNNVPCYAAQTNKSATHYALNSSEPVYCVSWPGNPKTLFGGL